MPELNVKLIREIQAAMRAEPFDVDMSDWFKGDAHNLSSCGTVGCIAGFACFCADREPDEDLAQFYRRVICGFGENAELLLGLTDTQAKHLFFVCAWPQPFRDQHGNLGREYQSAWLNRDCQGAAKLRKQMTEVVIARLDHLVATGE